MDKQILNILMEIQKNVNVIQRDVSTLQKDVNTLQKDVSTLKKDVSTLQKDVNVLQKDMNVVKSDIHEIKDTVNRIEVAQTEDVVGVLKMTKKKTDFEMDYVNNKITEMDKRLFILEKR
jgi:chromosome segregation ATPase